jgi:hypothetical protein
LPRGYQVFEQDLQRFWKRFVATDGV